jgi:lipopolysaccharide export system protein LptC
VSFKYKSLDKKKKEIKLSNIVLLTSPLLYIYKRARQEHKKRSDDIKPWQAVNFSSCIFFSRELCFF